MSHTPRTDPLPEPWLPEPAGPPDGDPEWEARVQRIAAAAEPRLRARRAGVREAGSRPTFAWTGLDIWLRPAAALAAAAALLIFALRPVRPAAEGPSTAPTLAALVSGGEPAALWRAAGSEAHPVLALIALEDEEATP